MMDLETLIGEVHKLLPSPAILPRLLKLLNDPEANSWAIVDLIKIDPALMVQVLALSNSAHYGVTEPTNDLQVAVQRVGYKELYKLVGIVLGQRLAGQKVEVYCLDENELWENALATGITMEAMARETGLSPTDAYTIGLLNGIGKLAINQLGGDAYAQVFQKIEQQNVSLIDAERDVLGFDHAMAGAALLTKWKFTAEITEPIQCQYRPLDAQEHKKMACTLHLARWVVATVGFNPGRDAWAMNVVPETLSIAGMAETSLQIHMMNVHKQVDAIKAMLKSAARKK